VGGDETLFILEATFPLNYFPIGSVRGFVSDGKHWIKLASLGIILLGGVVFNF
jgi:hypothetical protein